MPNEIKDHILNDAISGDIEAFNLIYEKYVDRIYNYTYYRIGNKNDAEDVTAKVFYRALKKIRYYKNLGVPFSAWLYRIAHNLVANWHRDNSRKKEVPIEENVNLQHQDQPPEIVMIQDEENEKLIRALKNLSPERQQLIILKYVERLSNSEIGIIMGRSEGAIKSLYHRTLSSLRNEYDKKEKKSATNK